MGFFITEREVEDLLMFQTRDLPIPNGTLHPYTGMKFMWRSYDYLIRSGKYTSKRLVELSMINSEEMGYSFEISFRNVVAYLHRILLKAQGIID